MTNHQQVSSFIWSVADDDLHGLFKQHEYGDVILPFVVLRRLDCVLESQKDKVAEKLSREYMITDPQGNIHHIKNLRKFCTENNLDQGNMTKVSNGKKGYNQHKGYLCTIK